MIASRSRAASQGFTLIEIMVVVVVIGIILAIARVNLMPDERQMVEDEAARLALLLELAHDTAATRSLSLAWSVSPQGYLFSQQNEKGDWVEQSAIETLRARTLPAEMRVMNVSIQHQAVPLTEKLLFTSSGVGTAFEIVLVLKQQQRRIVGNLAGRVWVEKDVGSM
ncbi:MAG: GspH/FimT family pseudopilin [Gallionella sp.]|nr:GspH/FimT family pseudopilin [Gallionella sp.]